MSLLDRLSPRCTAWFAISSGLVTLDLHCTRHKDGAHEFGFSLNYNAPGVIWEQA